MTAYLIVNSILMVSGALLNLIELGKGKGGPVAAVCLFVEVILGGWALWLLLK